MCEDIHREGLNDRELAQLNILARWLLRKDHAKTPKGIRRKNDPKPVKWGRERRWGPLTLDPPTLLGKFRRGPNAER